VRGESDDGKQTQVVVCRAIQLITLKCTRQLLIGRPRDSEGLFFLFSLFVFFSFFF
jgi:hypothetical protein